MGMSRSQAHISWAHLIFGWGVYLRHDWRVVSPRDIVDRGIWVIQGISEVPRFICTGSFLHPRPTPNCPWGSPERANGSCCQVPQTPEPECSWEMSQSLGQHLGRPFGGMDLSKEPNHHLNLLVQPKREVIDLGNWEGSGSSPQNLR